MQALSTAVAPLVEYLRQHPRAGADLVEQCRALPAIERALLDAFGVRVTAPDFTRQVQTRTSPALLERLLRRILDQWEQLGQREPHWSVLTHAEYYQERLDSATLANFYNTGRIEAGRLALLRDCFNLTPPGSDLIDFGCGVGRIATHLLEQGYRVLGVDISAGNLSAARQHLQAAGHSFTTLHLRDMAALDALPRASVVFSYGTLQHNPPPVQRYLLARLLRQLRPGGIALFQLPTYQPGYRFEVASYLADPPRTLMEMHCLPMSAVLATLRGAGMALLDVQQDDWTGGDFQSHSFLAVKPDEAAASDPPRPFSQSFSQSFSRPSPNPSHSGSSASAPSA
ncbi:Malonyl-CoA O-methyltransferase BioC [Thiorhodovibrio winogradskyi]|uniref:Malonyl-CoA O-methyltransferase BioC n=1 Tax=Thiorhodovibrio winogradskyi TaxID=77007 RepID=A0ABZ0S4Y4_9GAMM|nr:class I SAM-dependent methyltransferase [Thiorhodovibrio winogradskyi]